MTSNDAGEHGTSVAFRVNSIFHPSTSLRRSPTRPTSTHTNNTYEPLARNMLDAELDSDPQMSDSELSWQSVTDVDSLTATNHWRGWKQQATTSSTTLINPNNSLSSVHSTSICNTSLIAANEGEFNLKIVFSTRLSLLFRSSSYLGRFGGENHRSTDPIRASGTLQSARRTRARKFTIENRLLELS
jgi:hypothetical protein